MKYFSYGMNTNSTQMARRCPDSVCLGPARLPNYQLVFRGVADIEPAPDTWCDGVLWEISERDLDALDVLEGYPWHYTRFSVLVETAAKCFWMSSMEACCRNHSLTERALLSVS